MRLTLCLTICLVQIFSYTQAEKYTIIAPGIIEENSTYTVAVSTYDTDHSCKMNIGITSRRYKSVEQINVIPNEVANVVFDVPKMYNSDYYLTAEGVGCFDNFKNSTKLIYKKLTNYMVIQADKAVYKSGDDINFRVLFMNKDLKPAEPEKDAVIWFEDYNLNKVKEIANFTATNGVFAGKFIIPELHPNGLSRLVVQNGEKSLKYVYIMVDNILSKYIVKVEATPAVSIKNSVIKVVVTATDVSGKPLDGKVSIALSFDYVVAHQYVNMINGTANMDIDVKEYAAYLENKLSPTNAIIHATVEEQSTGDKIDVYTGSNIYSYNYSMKCVNYETCSTFEGDIEKTVLFQISNEDGTNLNDAKSTVELIYKEDFHKGPWVREMPWQNGIVIFKGHMNETGFVNLKISLPKLPTSYGFTTFYSLEMKYLGEQRTIANVFERKEPENDEYFMLMEQSPNNKLHFNESQQFTINSSRPLFYINYNVIGQGDIIQSGHVDLPDNPKVYDLTLTPQPSWTSDFAVYVYYVDTFDRFHYDAKKYHIGEPLNPITITATKLDSSGENVTLKIQTDPNSFVGLIAYDQRALILRNKNDLKPYDSKRVLSSHIRSTEHEGALSEYPAMLSGCVTLTNADYITNRIIPVYNPWYGFYGRITGEVYTPGAAKFYSVDDDDADDLDVLKTFIFADFVNTETGDFNASVRISETNTTWLVTASSLNTSTGAGVVGHETKNKVFKRLEVALNDEIFSY